MSLRAVYRLQSKIKSQKRKVKHKQTTIKNQDKIFLGKSTNKAGEREGEKLRQEKLAVQPTCEAEFGGLFYTRESGEEAFK